MFPIEFPGCFALVEMIDAAVGRSTADAIVDELRHGLCEMIRGGGVRLPSCVHRPAADRYVRRELYRSAEHGYGVVAMTWAPGQGTPIHDHGGVWCVESIWHGALEVTQYEHSEDGDGRCTLRAIGSVQAGAGSACSLAPPHEYHTTRNPSVDTVAVSLHIYGRTLTRCGVYQREPESCWYRQSERQLSLDPLR